MTNYRLFAFIAFISVSIFGYGQQKNYNQLDAKGKKTGYWKIFLDQNAMPTDSVNSVFYSYEFYDNGKKNTELFLKFSLKNARFTFEGIVPEKGNPVAIDGTLKGYQTAEGKEDILQTECVYENGWPKTYTEYFTGAGDVWRVTDFTKKYENTDGTFFTTDYYTYTFTTENRKKTTYWWYRKVGKKWKAVEAE